MSSATHMRHRCRRTRATPATPPRRNDWTSWTAANAATGPNTKPTEPSAPPARATLTSPTAAPVASTSPARSTVPVPPCRRRAANQEVATRWNVSAPISTLTSWPGSPSAMTLPVLDMMSMDPAKAVPAAACAREPLRSATAAAPEASPMLPATIWTRVSGGSAGAGRPVSRRIAATALFLCGSMASALS
jgi:hypothetical protein